MKLWQNHRLKSVVHSTQLTLVSKILDSKLARLVLVSKILDSKLARLVLVSKILDSKLVSW